MTRTCYHDERSRLDEMNEIINISGYCDKDVRQWATGVTNYSTQANP